MLCFNQSNGVCNIVVWWTVFWRHPNVRAEVFFDIQNIHERHSIALPTGRDMGCIFWVQRLLCFLLQSEQCCMQYRGMMGRVLAAPECTCRGFFWFTKYSREALHSSPHMKRYGVDIASSMSDISFVAIRAMLYSISWYDGPCFGGTRMYVPRFFDLQNIHERHSIALPTGRDMGCIIWVQRLLCFLLQSEQWCMQYRGMMGRVLAAPECTCRAFWFTKCSWKTLHNSPHRKRYGVNIASSMSAICSAAIRAMLYAISWYDGPCFGGTRLYLPIFIHRKIMINAVYRLY